MKKLILAIIAAGMLFTGCSKESSLGNYWGSIAGSVSDRTTGELVPTVNVTITPGGSSTVTGSDGSFYFQSLDEGSYTLTITKEGYKQNSSTVFVRAGESTSAHLLIERIPAVVTADRELLDFGSNASTNTLSFNIVNSSYEDLKWIIEERCEWITEVTPSEGTLKYGKTEGIVVVIDRSKLEPGDNEAVIVIRSSNGSSEMKVTTIGEENPLPVLTVLEATDVTTSTATLNGEIVEPGNPAYTDRGFVYSVSSMPTLENGTKVTASYSKENKYSCHIENLTYGQLYYVRAYAVNSKGVAYSGNETSFIPSEALPQVTTLEILDADFQKGTATLRGNIVFVGDPAYTERGFVYGTMHEPTIYDNKIAANGSGVTGSFSTYATGLPTSTYYVRAYATNSTGTAYGEEVTIISLDWVILSAAKLMVQKEDIGKGYWNSVNSMCDNSILGGYTDWHLPTKDELMTLYTNREYIGGFTTTGSSPNYWSSTYYGISCYYYISFNNGSIYYADSSYGYYNARCVRTLN